MIIPYERILVMHVTIIFGAILVIAFNEQLLALVLLVALKVNMDIRSHIKEHYKGKRILETN